RLRAESLAVRSEYRERIERLRARRDELYHAMRGELDQAFRAAHEEVAGVIRELQRGGTARDAARARERLLALEEAAPPSAEAAPVRGGGGPVAAGAPFAGAGDAAPVDWRFAAAGDAVTLRGGGSAVLLALPDRRGRVAVRVGSARVLVPAERVAALRRPAPPPPPRAALHAADGRGAGGPPGPGGLRGLRVDEARDRLAAELDRALSAGSPRLEIVHGVGTGALRRLVREELAASTFVARVVDAAPEQGGDGVTIAELT